MKLNMTLTLTDHEVTVLRKHLAVNKAGVKKIDRDTIKRWALSICHAAITDYESNQDEGIEGEAPR